MKSCSTCKSEKPSSEFHKNKRMPDGLCSQCKSCTLARVGTYYRANREKRKAYDAHYYEANRARKAAQSAAYYAVNAGAIKARVRQYGAQNKSSIAERRKAHRSANRDVIASRKRSHYWANRDRLLAEKSSYAKRNPHIFAANRAKRVAQTKRATPAWADRQAIADFYQEARYFGMELDHIVPLKSDLVCGLHWEGNMQLLDASENRSKRNRVWPDMP